MSPNTKLPHDQAHPLTLENPQYRETLEQFFAFQLSQDGCDITTNFILQGKQQRVTAEIITREQGVLSGQEELSWFFEESDIQNTWHTQDGEVFKSNETLLTLSGDAREILRFERTVLNVLSRMSGIATHANSFIQRLPENVFLAATRKTLWGMLDKKAVAVGGALTHRLGLFDALLFKENHLTLSDGIENVVTRVSEMQEASFWEIEVETENEFFRVLGALEQFSPKSPGVIMLDNFTPKDIVNILKKIDIQEWNTKDIFFEASGGITPENYLDFAHTGVNVISAGFLTKHALSLDLSLRILK